MDEGPYVGRWAAGFLPWVKALCSQSPRKAAQASVAGGGDRLQKLLEARKGRMGFIQQQTG